MLEEANGAAPDADAASTAAPVSEAPAPAPETSAPTIRDTMAAVLAKYPTRGDDGRYQSQFPKADDAPAEAAPANPETTDQPEAPTIETATPSIEPPASWSAEAKAKWASVPPDVQRIIADREAEAHKAITSTGERLKGYEGLDAVLGPRRDALKATWGDEATALRQLFDLSDFATRDPAGFVHWFAQQHRVDLSQLATPANAAPADPQVAALQHELHTIKSSLTQQQMAQMDADIQRFAKATDDAGNPLRPHFEAVRQEMGRLLGAQIANTLEDAYEQATLLNKDVRAKIEAEKAAAAAKAEADRQAKEREQRAKAAAEAKRAGAVNVRTVGGVSGSPVKGQTMRETMEAVAKQYFGPGAA